ncbi:hypothetical protein GCM10023238_20420 [Streptomyces heliomycini]
MTAMVKAEGVHKSFGPVEVLKGIDLEVRTGEVFCLIGPSGSGKSTFLRCINHLEKINAGRLYVDGELVGYRQKGDKLYELKDSEVAQQRRDIGMVFQRFNLFPHMTGRRERHGGAGPGEGREQGAGQGARDAAPGARGPRRQGEELPLAALRRPAAARGDRAGARDGPQADALRRADLGARPGAGR